MLISIRFEFTACFFGPYDELLNVTYSESDNKI